MEIKLSIIERRILANQNEILERLSIIQKDETGRKIAQRNQEILNEGYAYDYGDILGGYDEINYHDCREVREIFNMYHSLGVAIEEFKINIESYPFACFRGFDANGEKECMYMGYAHFLLYSLDMYRWIDRHPSFVELNSHCSTLHKYRQMLTVWGDSSFHMKKLPKDIAIEILEATQ